MSAAAAGVVDAAALQALAPSGVVRAAINLGNSVLAQRRDGELAGVSVDLARELARRLGVGIELVAYDAAGKVVDAVQRGEWDVAFLAVDPARAREIDFSTPYVLIEGAYVVPESSPFRSNDDVDRAGVRVATGQGAAYDLFLTRALKHAELVRRPTGVEALQAFVDGQADVGAGVRQIVEETARSHGAMRVLQPAFMAIRQAMAVPAGRAAGAHFVQGFIEEMKASGFVRDALQRSGQGEADVAPAA